MQVRRARPREKGEKLAAGNLLETGSRPCVKEGKQALFSAAAGMLAPLPLARSQSARGHCLVLNDLRGMRARFARGNQTRLLRGSSFSNKSHVRGHSNSRPSGLKAARARYVPFEQTAQAATC